MDQDLTKEAVFTVLDELRAIGIKPTVALVRERFQGASYSLISEYISSWSRAFYESTLEKFPPPPEQIAQGMARLWTQARLLSDEETEQERLDLGYQRESIEKDKQDMMLEIQRLESEYRPQDMLQDRFGAERSKLHAELDSLHKELKEIRLSQIDNTVDKQRLERDALGIELQRGQLHKELETKATIIEKLLAEKEMLQQKLADVDINKSEVLSNTQHTLTLAKSRIETLVYQLEEQKQSAIGTEEVKNLQTRIDNLQNKLSYSESKLLVSTTSESEQRSKQEILKRELELKEREQNELEKTFSSGKQENKMLERDYSRLKLELESLQNTVTQFDSSNSNIEELEHRLESLTTKKSQYQKVLKDKQSRYNLVVKQYEKLKKENEALRAVSKIQSSIANTEPRVKVPKAEVHDISHSGLDAASASKLKAGEDIMALARVFALEEEKKSHGEE